MALDLIHERHQVCVYCGGLPPARLSAVRRLRETTRHPVSRAISIVAAGPSRRNGSMGEHHER
jgi:hypothetical protein